MWQKKGVNSNLGNTMKKPLPRHGRAASPEPLRAACPCGALLRIPPASLDKDGRCPRCKRLLHFTGKRDERGRLSVHPLVVDDGKKVRTRSFRIEDHFREIPVPQKIPFFCPCGRKLFARPETVDKRGRCPFCGARLLLVGKTDARTHKVEIHPLTLDAPLSGDTFLLEE
jgi:DNA-directed RNA polymerase subunit RPC12/RpoP/phage FluMu protein Com